MSDQISRLTIFNNSLGHDNPDGSGLPVANIQIARGILKFSDSDMRIDLGAESSRADRTILALIDTGAEACHIDTSLAASLDLHPTGAQFEVCGVTGSPEVHNVHVATIWFPDVKRVYMQEMITTDFSSSPWKAILGMQFIRVVDLSINMTAGRATIAHL